MVCYIYLKINGREIMINEDDCNDIKMLSIRKIPKWKQVTIQDRGDGYKRINMNGKKLQLHRVIYYAHNQEWDIHDVSTNNKIDHIDGNKTNNNISNLRVVTAQQNQFNRHTAKGYSQSKLYNNWRAQIMLNKKNIHLGNFDTEEEARNAYLEAKKIYHIIPVQESSSDQEKPKPFSKKPS